jgi:hypothetical protein
MPQAILVPNPPIYASYIAGMTGASHHAQLRWGLANFFPLASLEPPSSRSLPSKQLGSQA